MSVHRIPPARKYLPALKKRLSKKSLMDMKKGEVLAFLKAAAQRKNTAQILGERGLGRGALERRNIGIKTVYRAGVPLPVLKTLGYTPWELHLNNFSDVQIKKAGFSAKEMLEGKVLPRIPSSPLSITTGHYRLHMPGYRKRIKKLNFSVEELREAGYPLYFIMEAYGLKRMRLERIPMSELTHSINNVADLRRYRKAGYSLRDFVTVASEDLLLKFGYSQSQINAAKRSKQ